jgi:hypothetical protein
MSVSGLSQPAQQEFPWQETQPLILPGRAVGSTPDPIWQGRSFRGELDAGVNHGLVVYF